MGQVTHKQILASELQDRIGSVLKEVEKGGVFYTVRRYKTPKMAIVNLNDLTPLKSFICEQCVAKEHYERKNLQSPMHKSQTISKSKVKKFFGN